MAKKTELSKLLQSISPETLAKANARRAAAALSKGDLKFAPETSGESSGRSAAAKSLTNQAEAKKIASSLASNSMTKQGFNSGQKSAQTLMANHKRNAVNQSVPTRRSGKKG
ncbi:MAG: hypothetical protein DWI24_02185 [Planctomycetota bacterium]|nr:MAG: hypothetical protein DWI24_02185 [Planctomycetota bacterium]